MTDCTAVVLYAPPPMAEHVPLSQRKAAKLKRRAAIVEKVCARIAEGALIANAAKAEGISYRTYNEWITEQPHLAQMNARAREMAADELADEARRVADGVDSLGEAAQQLADGEIEGMDPDKQREFLARFESSRVTRDRLRVDTLKWTAAKRRPKVYGDKMDLTSGGEKLEAPQMVVIGGRSITF